MWLIKDECRMMATSKVSARLLITLILSLSRHCVQGISSERSFVEKAGNLSCQNTTLEDCFGTHRVRYSCQALYKISPGYPANPPAAYRVWRQLWYDIMQWLTSTFSPHQECAT